MKKPIGIWYFYFTIMLLHCNAINAEGIFELDVERPVTLEKKPDETGMSIFVEPAKVAIKSSADVSIEKPKETLGKEPGDSLPVPNLKIAAASSPNTSMSAPSMPAEAPTPQDSEEEGPDFLDGLTRALIETGTGAVTSNLQAPQKTPAPAEEQPEEAAPEE